MHVSFSALYTLDTIQVICNDHSFVGDIMVVVFRGSNVRTSVTSAPAQCRAQLICTEKEREMGNLKRVSASARERERESESERQRERETYRVTVSDCQLAAASTSCTMYNTHWSGEKDLKI
jgi:hypothetical protein